MYNALLTPLLHLQLFLVASWRSLDKDYPAHSLRRNLDTVAH